MFPCRYGRRNSCTPVVPPPRVPFAKTGLGVVGVGLWTRVRGCVPVFDHVARPPSGGGVLVVLGVCVASVRPISTGRLGIAAVHLRPINPIVCGGPYTLKGWETSS